MAILYVRSTDGNDSDNGSTWALAKATLGAAITAASAGDTIYVSHQHAETFTTSQSWTLSDVASNPIYVICVNDSAEPPTASATSATITNITTSSSVTIIGNAYFYGITIGTGVTSGTGNMTFGSNTDSRLVFEDCGLDLLTTNANAQFRFGTSSTGFDAYFRFQNCDFVFSASSGGFAVGNARVEINGGSVVSNSGTGGVLIEQFYQGGSVSMSGVDMSGLPSDFDLITGSATTPSIQKLRNCKFPDSWSGSLFASSVPVFARGEVSNCSSTDANYEVDVEDAFGKVVDETAIYRTGGASDGVVAGLSWKIVTSSSCGGQPARFYSPEMVVWNDTIGSPVAAKVHIIHSGVGGGTAGDFKDDEVWLEVQYYGTNGLPISSFLTDAYFDENGGNRLAAGVDQPDSAATWASSPSTPVEQELSVTFTPYEKGFVIARVVCAVADKTLYVCPKIELS